MHVKLAPILALALLIVAALVIAVRGPVKRRFADRAARKRKRVANELFRAAFRLDERTLRRKPKRSPQLPKRRPPSRYSNNN